MLLNDITCTDNSNLYQFGYLCKAEKRWQNLSINEIFLTIPFIKFKRKMETQNKAV